jgi:hypothetical protein
MAMECKAFGIADDIYAGGLLLAYVVFVPFCEMGNINGPSLQEWALMLVFNSSGFCFHGNTGWFFLHL